VKTRRTNGALASRRWRRRVEHDEPGLFADLRPVYGKKIVDTLRVVDRASASRERRRKMKSKNVQSDAARAPKAPR